MDNNEALLDLIDKSLETARTEMYKIYRFSTKNEILEPLEKALIAINESQDALLEVIV